MLRFLKWIFLVFGGLALVVLSFFYIQNKHDLGEAFDYYGKLQYETVKSTCLNSTHDYYYPCFYDEFEKYLQRVSLTGMSLGLKMAFTFMDLDKLNTKKFETDIEKDIAYSLNYLELNNLAMKNSYKRFFGLEFTYGGFVGKVQDNLEKATAFSDGIIAGLKGSEGITKLNNPTKEEKFHQKLGVLILDYQKVKKSVEAWLDVEIKMLEKKYK